MRRAIAAVARRLAWVDETVFRRSKDNEPAVLAA